MELHQAVKTFAMPMMHVFMQSVEKNKQTNKQTTGAPKLVIMRERHFPFSYDAEFGVAEFCAAECTMPRNTQCDKQATCRSMS